MADHDEFERECARIRGENAKLISGFASWLKRRGLADSTIKKYSENVDFYINEYLLYEDVKEPSDGVDEVRMFFGYWFIRKTTWASETSMKEAVASLKKFYAFVAECGVVDPESVRKMRIQIREGMPEWLATLKRYDDPEIDVEEVWGW